MTTFREHVEDLTGHDVRVTATSRCGTVHAALQGERDTGAKREALGMVVQRDQGDLEFYRLVVPGRVSAGMGSQELLAAGMCAVGLPVAAPRPLRRAVRLMRIRDPELG